MPNTIMRSQNAQMYPPTAVPLKVLFLGTCIAQAVLANDATRTTYSKRHDKTAYLMAKRRSTTSEIPPSLSNKPPPKKPNPPPFFKDPLGCTLYLAGSSIPNSGLGIYSGINWNKNDVATFYDIPIVYTDIRGHNPTFDADDFKFLPTEYCWNSITNGGQHMAEQVEMLIPSFGMLANSHLGLHNTKGAMNTDDDLAHLHRAQDPGAGAVTDSHTMRYFTTQPIARGEEIFVNYGENYFMGREESWGITIPKESDYPKANEAAKRFNDVISKSSSSSDDNCSISPKLQQATWDAMRSLLEPRVNAALPSDAASVPAMVETGAARFPLKNIVRSMDDLEANGQCLDNLTIRPSTIAGAGRGAFASRFIPAGSLVAPAPLVHMPDKKALNMYKLYQETPRSYPEKVQEEADVPVGKQLLLNYCFGHASSSILLFPYSQAVQMINHRRGGDGEGPNAKIVWSSHSYHHAEWLNVSIDDLPGSKAGLMFDIIATRDIYPNDEVFLDYGDEWDDAWKAHVKSWEPTPDAEEYSHPDVLNAAMAKEEGGYLTIDEELEDPSLPPNIDTGCYYTVNSDNKPLPDGTYEWMYEGEYFFTKLRGCEILERKVVLIRNQKRYRYTVNIRNYRDIGEDQLVEWEGHRVVNVPHNAIQFIEKPYANDMFLPNAFRKEIGIPDEMIPEAWKNLNVAVGIGSVNFFKMSDIAATTPPEENTEMVSEEGSDYFYH